MNQATSVWNVTVFDLFWQKIPHFDTRFKSHEDGRKSSGCGSGSSVDSKRKGWDEWHIPKVLQSCTSSPQSLLVVWFGTLPQLLDQLKNITSNKIMHNLVNSDHLQCRCYPLLLNEFKHFNIKVAVGPVVQKEVYEQLVKGATKPSTGGANFTLMSS